MNTILILVAIAYILVVGLVFAFIHGANKKKRR